MSSEIHATFPRWNYAERGPCSLSGVRVEGTKLVRLVYLDESGISVHEPVTVVAGVVINADQHWMRVDDYVRDLIDEYVPKEHRDGFIFHAKDLFHGSGLVFDKRKYPIEKSHEALLKLVSIPATFQIPIVSGHLFKRPSTGFDKQALRYEPGRNHTMAFSFCALAAERYLRHDAEPLEVATLVVEDNTDTRRRVKEMHRLLRGTLPRSEEGDEILSVLLEYAADCLPIRRIVDTVYFADKQDAFLLQIADACALMIRYYFENRNNAAPFLDALTQGNPSVFGERVRAGFQVVNFKPVEGTSSESQP